MDVMLANTYSKSVLRKVPEVQAAMGAAIKESEQLEWEVSRMATGMVAVLSVDTTKRN